MRPIIASSLCVLGFLAACSGASDQGLGNGSSALSGPIDMHLKQTFAPSASTTDATMQPTSIVVTIARVAARVDDGRDDDHDALVTLVTGPMTIDLLSLPSSGFVSLGIAKLPAGGAEQLRLFVSDAGPSYVRTADGVTHTLVVPSGSTSGIKVVGDFDVAPCSTGTIALAFDGPRAVVAHPATAEDNAPAGAWILRPVIRIDEVVVSGTCPTTGENENDQGEDRNHQGNSADHDGNANGLVRDHDGRGRGQL
jgi:hypothetical protein